MANKLNFIIDVGSSKIRLAITQQLAHTSKIVSLIEKDYDGYADSEFFNPVSVKLCLQDMVNSAIKHTNSKIKHVYVGVPSEFCVCVCKRISSCLPKTRKISREFIDSLLAKGNGMDSEKFKVINYSPMKYTIDGDIDIVQPIGHKTQNISVDCSYILAKRDFINLCDEALHSAGVENITYLCSALAQALSINAEPRLEPTIIVDVGHITTSVAVLKGEGLIMLSSFSLGGGHISADLMQLLKMSYADADLIKRKAILTIQPEKTERYEIKIGDRVISSLIQITNDIICSRIENIGQLIENLLKIDTTYSQYPIYLTGDGLVNIKGARQVLSSATKQQVLPFEVENYEKIGKYQTSVDGLVKLVSKLV
ncbi:MAG: rod shape-determining protein [Clostridia bacterium]|nr:rod shape-determining protein [Clostridia bacterium]